MMKNLFLLGLLTWVSFTFAKTPVARENIAEAEAYKVEKGEPEQEAQRSVAGAKIKKKKVDVKGDAPKTDSSESDSEVRYWQYSE